MRRVGIIAALLLGVAAFAGTFVFLWRKSEGDPVPLETETVARRSIVHKTVATGAIEPRREIELKPRVSGIVAELFVQPGDRIETAAPVAHIRLVPDAVRVNEAEAAVRTARINYDNAVREMKRYEELAGVVSKAEIEAQRLALELREQELAAAQSHLKLVREGASSSTSNLASNRVTSTVSGTVLDVRVELGDSVTETNTFSAGTTVATIADMGDMIFRGWVDEAEVGKLRVGMPLDIRVGALEDVTFAGTLEFIAPKSTKNEGAIQFEVRAAVASREDVFLRAGYSANADIVLEKKDDVLALNERALQFDGPEAPPYVELVTGPETFERREIDTGLSDGIYIEVAGGLDEGDEVRVPTSEGSPKKRRGS